jgi:hypothetical protein
MRIIGLFGTDARFARPEILYARSAAYYNTAGMV